MAEGGHDGAWYCGRRPQFDAAGLRNFCPPEGCPKGYCALDDGWKPGELTPDRCLGSAPMPAPDKSPSAVGGVDRMREALAKCVTFIEMLRDDGAEQLSEGVHAGLRKGTDAPDAHALWSAIASSSTTAWPDAIEFALDPFFSMWGGDEALKEAEAALASGETSPDRGASHG